MLSEGHRRKQRGTDVAIGFVECHGRPLTEEMISDLEVIPRRVVEYRGARFEEMDLDAVIERHPGVALVDELAHTNVSGFRAQREALAGRHRDPRTRGSMSSPPSTSSISRASPIRWNGSPMCRSGSGSRTGCSGRPIRSSLSIRPLSSSVAGCSTATSTRPRRFPRRWPTSSAETTWWPSRELALRFLADETDEQLLNYLRLHQSPALWETRERILVAVTTAPAPRRLFAGRRGWRPG